MFCRAAGIALVTLILSVTAVAWLPAEDSPIYYFSIGNQTVRVSPKPGQTSIVIPNVPPQAFINPSTESGPALWYRLRMRSGTGTIEAQSPTVFNVVPNLTVNAGVLQYGSIDAVPAKIGVSADSTSVSYGAAVHIHVMATYPDGSTKDVSAAGHGTLYGTTNPNIASVTCAPPRISPT